MANFRNFMNPFLPYLACDFKYEKSDESSGWVHDGLGPLIKITFEGNRINPAGSGRYLGSTDPIFHLILATIIPTESNK